MKKPLSPKQTKPALLPTLEKVLQKAIHDYKLEPELVLFEIVRNLTIVPANLTAALSEQPLLMAYVAYQCGLWKVLLTDLEGTADQSIRKQMQENGGKTTETQVAYLVAGNLKVDHAKCVIALFTAISEALRQRFQIMLVLSQEKSDDK